MRNNHRFCSVIIICNTLKSLEDEDERKIDWTTIKKFLKILCFILIIFTTLYATFFGCFLVLNNSITRAPQTVTLSSEGPANEMYPDSMGEYQLAEEVIQGRDGDYTWYRHKDREDRFLMYNNLGKIETSNILIIFYFLSTDYRWYITLTNETENTAGAIRSVPSGRIIFPELQWEYLTFNIPQCTTAR